MAVEKRAPRRWDPAGPRLEVSCALELLPVRARLKNVDVRFCIARRLLALELLRHHAIMEFRLHRYRRGHHGVGKMINEMLGLGVFPLVGMNGQRLLPQRTWISLAQPREFHFRERIRAGGRGWRWLRKRPWGN